MKYLEGFDRSQTLMQVDCPEDWVAKDSDARKIDTFVDGLDLTDLGFRADYGENGRPAYHPGYLLKLYLYGYLNGNRSSRELERECVRNLEVKWLMRGLKPDHNTIANFRKDNHAAIARAFAATVQTALSHGLIGGTLLAGDSTKLRAQNSRKNNFNPAKVKQHTDYIDKKIQDYTQLLADMDGDSPEADTIKKKVAQHKTQRGRYERIGQTLEQSEANQISTSDPDSRMLITRGLNTEVCYNAQTTVDAKHNLIIDYLTTNQKDDNAMAPMVERACDILGHNNFTALYDKGYYSGEALQTIEELGPDVMVAIPDVASHAPDHAFDMEHFQYDLSKDQYICPAGKKLTTNGTFHPKKNGKRVTHVLHYKTSACGQCPLKARCTRNPKGRTIERSEYAHLYEENRQRIQANPELYRKRQQIVEHPFGTIKRQWGFDHIMTKRGIQRASADIGLIFIAYNLRRMFNILGDGFNPDKNKLQNGLKKAFSALLDIHKAIQKVTREIFDLTTRPQQTSTKRLTLAQ